MNLRKKWENFMLETKEDSFWGFILFSVALGLVGVVAIAFIYLFAWLFMNFSAAVIFVFIGIPILLLVGRVLLQKE